MSSSWVMKIFLFFWKHTEGASRDKEFVLKLHLLTSRWLIIGLAAISNCLIPEHNANVFMAPNPSNNGTGFMDVLVRWDGQYFLHIALDGYTYENTLAFYPLLPFSVQAIAKCISIFISDYKTAVLFVYFSLNLVFTILAMEALLRLTEKAFGSKFAYYACGSFIINPAAIFFVAPYTESLFCYLTFNAILHSSDIYFSAGRLTYKPLIKAVLYIALSAATRSNGLLNIGFLIFFYTTSWIVDCLQYKFKFAYTIIYLHILFVAVVAALIPFAIIQHYFHYLFCTDHKTDFPEYIISYAEENSFVLPGQYSLNKQSWCNYTVLPMPYSYVQDKYWNVGFMKYYELKQIPNFLLATPIICVSLLGVAIYLKKIYQEFKCLQSKLIQLRSLTIKEMLKFYKYRIQFVCVVHCLALTIFCIFFVHIQVTTRLLCAATPAVYWFMNQMNSKWISIWCVLYLIVGTVMFANFYPWT